ncbi:MAG TPA: hypothetical protein EYP98_15795 [Planctomycetes bacterium]|nr:hypothetical protein [Planctomycetota bacterium]
MMIPMPRAALFLLLAAPLLAQAEDNKTVRVFIFAGQSNMVGSDSKVKDIKRFPPFAGLEEPQAKVRFSYCIGRENKERSDGWTELQPVDGIVGPELSFAREVTKAIKAPIAIIKIAAGGTTIGGDWNPDEPSGFKMYPLALETVRASLAALDKKRVPWRLEGFVWHQGENDMFNEEYRASYGTNLKNFLARCRADLKAPKLPFFIGELCTKTIWGMDQRPRMYEISVGQRAVTTADAFAHYIPTSHVGVEIGRPVGLHYHYGTLGQLEHGVNYAEAYLRSIGKLEVATRPLKKWPYKAGSTVDLFVLAGHRNMEGERAFVQELAMLKGSRALRKDQPGIAYRYSLGGGVKISGGWEPLGVAGLYDTFGPELSFGQTLRTAGHKDIAIAKFTDSGSQIIDWTKAGSVAKSRNLYPQLLAFVRDSVAELKAKGHRVNLRGIYYHLGENDMSWNPFRRGAAKRLQALVTEIRKDLKMPKLVWVVSQQRPTDQKDLNKIDVVADVAAVAAADPHMTHLRVFDLPPQEKKLVLDTAGVVRLGELLAGSVSR